MKCKNCGVEVGSKGNKHIKSRKYTCTRYSSSGSVLPDVVITTSDWGYSDNGYSSGYSGGSDTGYSYSGE